MRIESKCKYIEHNIYPDTGRAKKTCTQHKHGGPQLQNKQQLQREEKGKKDKLHATKIRQKIRANEVLFLIVISNKVILVWKTECMLIYIGYNHFQTL